LADKMTSAVMKNYAGRSL